MALKLKHLGEILREEIRILSEFLNVTESAYTVTRIVGVRAEEAQASTKRAAARRARFSAADAADSRIAVNPKIQICVDVYVK